ncbi:MAG: preprotein translocase subunit SecE [Victivallaceae bacterium]|nr:preprotein translocase subunit SecE [Victivallaceae bacterium]
MEKHHVSLIGKIRQFAIDTVAEMKRCTWPNRRQLLESTILVVVVMLLLACFVAGVDELALKAIRFVTTGKF